VVSKRVAPILSADKELVSRYFQCKTLPYHPDNAPDGYINFGTAENYLLWDLLEPKAAEVNGLTELDSHYADLHGKASFRSAIAQLFSERAGRNISPDHIVTAAGTTAILEILAYCLCDPGDAILVPAPFYSGFGYAFTMRAQTNVIPVPGDAQNGFSVSITDLKQALEEARSRDVHVAAVLTSCPHNPLGSVLNETQVNELAQFCADEGLELILDEVFAETRHLLSPTSGLNAPTILTSGMSLDSEHVHTVYGFAKDFALSGLAVGVLHSKNQAVLDAATELAHFSRVSNHTQTLITHLLSDHAWVQSFLHQAQTRLTAAYKVMHQALQAANIPFVEPVAGVCVFVDLSQFLTEPSFAAEKALSDRIFAECRVNLSPGSLFYCPEPGWFRLTYTLDSEQVATGIRRLINMLR